MSLTKFLKDKKVGFWFSVAISVLFLITGILYLAATPNLVKYTEYALKIGIPEWFFTLIGVLCILGFVASGVCIALKQYKLTTYLEFVLSLICFLCFAYASFSYVFELLVGIQLQDHVMYPAVVVMFILFILTLGLSIANVFLKQTNEEVVEEGLVNE